MRKQFLLTGLLLLFFIYETYAQTADSLRQRIDQILSTKNANVGVSKTGVNEKDTLSVNGDRHYPLQSVYKLHIALAVVAYPMY
ncbi:MAG TPA: hypothetical protein VIL90_08475 [Puia sp.]